MWLGWFESVDIYLGQGVVLLQHGKNTVQVVRQPATWGLSRILAGIAHAMEPTHSTDQPTRSAKRRRFHLTLGATLCPAIGFTAPQEVHRLEELQSIAQASAAAAHAGLQVTCAMDALQPGVAASVGNHLLTELTQWAQSQGGHMASIRPIWSVASQCKAVRKTGVRGLAVQEPGALTLLAQKAGGGMDALTLAGEWDASQLPAQLRRWQVAHALDEGALAHLKFGPDAQTRMAQGPSAWAAHWSRS